MKLSRYRETAKELGTLQVKAGTKKYSVKTFGFNEHSDGFTFQVNNELDAFVAAYYYKGVKNVKVMPDQQGTWMVQVYTK